MHCTFAVTGRQEYFQAIYVCNTCSRTPDDLLCLCQACADECHSDHDGLDYVGMGPAYCDCRRMKSGCCIGAQSDSEATRLKIEKGSLGFTTGHSPSNTASSNVRDVYKIRTLQDKWTASYVQDLALELVKHSKDTFWLDDGMDPNEFCGLEKVAWQIFCRHTQQYSLSSGKGVEWWVQVKPVAFAPPADNLAACNNDAEAIDLHYDKDEVVAESFGLGVFPVLSTVTYLTEVRGSSPTVVFSRRYEADDEIEDVLVSHPRRGKHLVFNGQLLHGAPSHFSLRETSLDMVAEERETHRITLLANIWVGHQPAGVFPLPAKVRQAILGVRRVVSSAPVDVLDNLTFEARPVSEERFSPTMSEAGCRVELPFVGKGTTWEAADDVHRSVLSMYVAPRLLVDTVIIKFPAQCRPFVYDVDDLSEEAGSTRSSQ